MARSCRRFVVAGLAAAMLAPAAPALAQSGSANPLVQQSTSPFTPGVPQGPVGVPSASTPTVITNTSTNSSSDSGLTGTSAVAIGVGALVVLGGISFFIWHDARRRAPIRHRAAAAAAGAGERAAAKQRAKPRKLSPAERRRRKRGRAR